MKDKVINKARLKEIKTNTENKMLFEAIQKKLKSKEVVK